MKLNIWPLNLKSKQKEKERKAKRKKIILFSSIGSVLVASGGGVGLYFLLNSSKNKTVIFNNGTEFYNWVNNQTQFWCNDPLDFTQDTIEEKLTNFFLNTSDASFINRRVGIMNISTCLIAYIYGNDAESFLSGSIKIKYSSKKCNILCVTDIVNVKANVTIISKSSTITIGNNKGKYNMNYDVEKYAKRTMSHFAGDVLLEHLSFLPSNDSSYRFKFAQTDMPFTSILLLRSQYPNVKEVSMSQFISTAEANN